VDRSPGYKLQWAGDDAWTLTFDPDAHGGLVAERVPVGAATLLRRQVGAPGDEAPRWTKVGSFEVARGLRTRFRVAR
jgi:hypothetical protein